MRICDIGGLMLGIPGLAFIVWALLDIILDGHGFMGKLKRVGIIVLVVSWITTGLYLISRC